MHHAESTAEIRTPTNIPDVVTLADTAEDFLARKFPEKEPLIEHLLHRRDLVALGARRRHGKTSFLTNMAVAMAIPVPDFLGYRIPERRRTLMLALEDDPGEYQNFLRAFVGNNNLHGALRVMTREHFHDADVQIDATNSLFQELVFSEAMAHKADDVVFDNLAHIVNADYNDSKKIHNAMKFVYRLAADVNCVTIIAAHPRKDQGDDLNSASKQTGTTSSSQSWARRCSSTPQGRCGGWSVVRTCQCSSVAVNAVRALIRSLTSSAMSADGYSWRM